MGKTFRDAVATSRLLLLLMMTMIRVRKYNQWKRVFTTQTGPSKSQTALGSNTGRFASGPSSKGKRGRHRTKAAVSAVFRASVGGVPASALRRLLRCPRRCRLTSGPRVGSGSVSGIRGRRLHCRLPAAAASLASFVCIWRRRCRVWHAASLLAWPRRPVRWSARERRTVPIDRRWPCRGSRMLAEDALRGLAEPGGRFLPSEADATLPPGVLEKALGIHG